MTHEQADAIYFAQIDLPHGAAFADTVGRLQEGFLRDKVTDDIDEAFRRAVDTASRILPAIRVRAEVRAAAGLSA